MSYVLHVASDGFAIVPKTPDALQYNVGNSVTLNAGVDDVPSVDELKEDVLEGAVEDSSVD